MKHTPKFAVGQVVRITAYGARFRPEQCYQRITAIFSWPACKKSPFGYKFFNKDACNEKYVVALSAKECGVLGKERG